MKKIRLSLFEIEIALDEKGRNSISSQLKEICPHCGYASCWFDCDESQAEDSLESEEEANNRIYLNAAMDGIENLILAHACTGIDVESPTYLEGIEIARSSTISKMSEVE